MLINEIIVYWLVTVTYVCMISVYYSYLKIFINLKWWRIGLLWYIYFWKHTFLRLVSEEMDYHYVAPEILPNNINSYILLNVSLRKLSVW